MRRLRALTWLNAKPKPCASGHGPRRMFASDSWQMILDMDGVLYKNAEVEKRDHQEAGQGHREARPRAGCTPRAFQITWINPPRSQEAFSGLTAPHAPRNLQGLLSEGHLSGDAIAAFYASVYDGVDLEVGSQTPGNAEK